MKAKGPSADRHPSPGTTAARRRQSQIIAFGDGGLAGLLMIPPGFAAAPETKTQADKAADIPRGGVRP
jgi:hypothetical protein